MNRFRVSGYCILLVAATLIANRSAAQTVGIGVDAPAATLDIRTTLAMPSLQIERTLAVPALFNPAVLITDDSDYGVLEAYQQSAANAEVLAYFQHDGTGTGIWSALTNAANAEPAGYFSQVGTGPGLAVYQTGTGDGMQVLIDEFLHLEDGVQITHLGNGYGLFINAYNITDNILNFVESGIGITNLHFADNTASMIVDKAGFIGTGFDGDGYYFTNTNFGTPASGADGYAFVGFTNTQTVYNPVSGVVYGAVFAGEELGNGHGLLLNHYGNSGYGGEINIASGGNPDPALFLGHNGPGSALVARNADNTITGTMAVADVAYVGTDVDDHYGLVAYSYPAAGWGVGTYAAGGYVGVVGDADNASALAGLFAVGEVGATGAKPFIIDHPERPETHMLKHFSVESDKVLNMYQGNVRLGRTGRAVVELPSYFDDINTDFSYQLTPVGASFQPWIASKITGNRFEIGGKPGSEVSWVVFARRNDAYARAHADRLQPEQPKRPQDVGLYLDPGSHGKPEKAGMFYREPPAKPRVPALRPSVPAGQDPAWRKGLQKRESGTSMMPSRKPAMPFAEPGFPEQRMQIKREIRTWDEIH